MPLLPLDLPEGSGPVALGLALDAGTCELAPAERGAGGLSLGAVASALADWARAQGALVAVPVGAHAACDGVPVAAPLAVPVGGWAIGTTVAPVEVRADGLDPAAIVPIGADRTWWHVPPATGAVAFVLPDGLAPALFTVTPAPDVLPPAGWVVRVPVGEARDTPAQGTPLSAVLVPPDVAAVVELGGRVVVLGLREGTADGQLREGVAAPQAVHATVEPGAVPPVALGVAAGRARSWRLDGAAVTEVAVVEPGVATVVPDGRLLRVTGVRPGSTAVALRRADGRIEVVWVLVR